MYIHSYFNVVTTSIAVVEIPVSKPALVQSIKSSTAIQGK